MRFVPDTNVVVSGLFWLGPPREVLEVGRRPDVTLFTSPSLLVELDAVLHRPKLDRVLAASGTTADRILGQYAALASLVRPTYVPNVVERDPDDNNVIACALAARASHIVSGDNHLLELGEYCSVLIVDSPTFLDHLFQER